MRVSKALAAAAVLGLLGGCGGGQDQNSGVTSEEAAALNDTENMLDISSEDIPTDETAVGNTEVPMDDLGGADEVPPANNGTSNTQ
ncbi:MAG TPA: hypothetical protein VGD10_06760 [Allosphingosinicella sp.]|uniref:hypothetical protein n=1 Tax=Allosphingosinicella sp. TaxID=2823234 RepID=UPI002ED876E9